MTRYTPFAAAGLALVFWAGIGAGATVARPHTAQYGIDVAAEQIDKGDRRDRRREDRAESARCDQAAADLAAAFATQQSLLAQPNPDQVALAIVAGQIDRLQRAQC